MSDSFPAPTPEPSLPPPPGDLAPPPGYVGYQPSPMGVVRLGRVNGIAKALTILLAVYAAVAALGTVVNRMAADPARDFLRDELSEDEFTDELGPFFASSVVLLGVTIAVVVLTIIWMFRVASNHRDVGRRTTWAPGLAIAGWFLPPFLFVIPLLVLLEMWKASDPSAPLQSDTWKQSSINPLVPVWWVFYGLVPVVLFFTGRSPISNFGGDTQDFAEQIDEQQVTMFLQSLAAIAAAITFLFVVRGVTDRHTRLTGEATTR